ncbi:hypothetical protein Celaphus_00009364, partial [Cervus elaphus hippelaphus]
MARSCTDTAVQGQGLAMSSSSCFQTMFPRRKHETSGPWQMLDPTQMVRLVVSAAKNNELDGQTGFFGQERDGMDT